MDGRERHRHRARMEAFKIARNRYPADYPADNVMVTPEDYHHGHTVVSRLIETEPHPKSLATFGELVAAFDHVPGMNGVTIEIDDRSQLFVERITRPQIGLDGFVAVEQRRYERADGNTVVMPQLSYQIDSAGTFCINSVHLNEKGNKLDSETVVAHEPLRMAGEENDEYGIYDQVTDAALDHFRDLIAPLIKA